MYLACGIFNYSLQVLNLIEYHLNITEENINKLYYIV